MLPTIPSLRQPEYQISKSLRFRSSASAYLSRTFASGLLETTGTFSAWIKRGRLGVVQNIFTTGNTGQNFSTLYFTSGDQIEFARYAAGYQCQLTSTQVFRDTSAWYHIVVAWDSTQATASNRVKMYVNGVQITAFATATYPTQNLDMYFLNGDGATPHQIGYYPTTGNYFDGYLAEVNAVKSQALTPAAFGATSSKTGVWAPKKYLGTYGTNGFYLKFANTSSVAALGTDSSGNNNTWTVNNVSLTAGATYDSMIDVPVNYADGGNGRGNYAVLNPLVPVVNASITNANLTANVTSASRTLFATFDLPTSGKWYCEFTPAAITGTAIGIHGDAAQTKGYWSNGTCDVSNAYGATYTVGDVIGCAFNVDSSSVEFFKNSVSQGVQTSVALNRINIPMVSDSGTSTAHINFGQRPFAYTPPAGFKALCTQNLPEPAIVHGHAYMAATTYTGTGVGRNISNFSNNRSFRPDLVWIKSRSNATDHALYDTLRGAQQDLVSNSTAAETTQSTGLTAFREDGFGLSTLTKLNSAGNTYVAWQWKAGDSTVTNTAGSITSQVDAGTTQGVSVVTYTGTGANATVGHGLGVAPKMVIYKSRSLAGENWPVYHTGITNPATNQLRLNATTASESSTNWNSTAPTSSVFSISNGLPVGSSGVAYVAYCFAEIAGYSKFGSYTGNGSADGPFVFCNFRPKFVMIKRTDVAGDNWFIHDTTREASNFSQYLLVPNQALAESTGGGNCKIDILSNGFKIRDVNVGYNGSGNTMIYAAFAEVPSKYALAR